MRGGEIKNNFNFKNVFIGNKSFYDFDKFNKYDICVEKYTAMMFYVIKVGRYILSLQTADHFVRVSVTDKLLAQLLNREVNL